MVDAIEVARKFRRLRPLELSLSLEAIGTSELRSVYDAKWRPLPKRDAVNPVPDRRNFVSDLPASPSPQETPPKSPSKKESSRLLATSRGFPGG
jgi:hypothetical protein